MGFSSPKAVTPEPAPPPVTTNSNDAAAASAEERRKQRRRGGYQATLLSSPEFMGRSQGKKTLLGGPN